jgi:hypothetical protein
VAPGDGENLDLRARPGIAHPRAERDAPLARPVRTARRALESRATKRLVLIGAICGALGGAGLSLAGNDAETEPLASSPPQVVKSRDGGLVVSVPRGALRKPVKVRVRVLTRAQYPPELRDATFRPGSKLYALEPSGQRFLKPVTVTRRIDAKLQGFDLDKAVPGIVLATRSAAGKWEWLGAQSARAAKSTLLVSATTRHFSTLAAFDSAARVTITPDTVDKFVGESWETAVKLDVDNRIRRDPILLTSTEWSADAFIVDLAASRGKNGATFTCLKEGDNGYFGAKVVFEEDNLAVNVGTLGTGEVKETVYFTGKAKCRKPQPTPAQLATACVVVAHTPLGSFPSFTRWLLQFARANLPANAQASLTVAGVNNGQAMSQPVNAGTGKVELVGGISSFGPKQVQQLTVSGQNVTSQLVAKVGAAPNVTAAQGTIAGQCPP